MQCGAGRRCPCVLSPEVPSSGSRTGSQSQGEARVRSAALPAASPVPGSGQPVVVQCPRHAGLSALGWQVHPRERPGAADILVPRLPLGSAALGLSNPLLLRDLGHAFVGNGSCVGVERPGCTATLFLCSPGLVNNTGIDWFMPWPPQALHAVAKSFLGEWQLGRGPH